MRATGFSTLADWLSWLETLHPKKIDMSLDRIRLVLDSLSLRPPPFRVITVGGTNGKGSCVAILESVYRSAGYRTGAFTSPHLWRFNERIRVNGEEATDAQLVSLFGFIDATRGQVTLSYFESSAVAALLHFARENVDVAILEVGLGGRLDAVNAVDADATLIASIDLDHQEWLGPDRESVGREKAGIMRGGRPAVVADRDPPRSLIAHAAGDDVDLRLIGRDFDFIVVDGARTGPVAPTPGGPTAATSDQPPPGERWTYRGARGETADLPRPVFGGDIQFTNSAACTAVVEAMQSVLAVDRQALADGLAGATLPGRLDRRQVSGVEWVFDVAHNPAAARELAAAVRRLPRAARTLAVFGAMHDKDISGVVQPFMEFVDEWFVACAEPARGASAAAMAVTLTDLGAQAVTPQPDVETACRSATLRAAPGDRVLAFGSFYLVGPAMEALGLYCAPTCSDQSARWTGV